MALKALLLKKKLDAKRAALQALLTRQAAMKLREEELEASINKVTEETPQEDRDALDEEVANFETDRAALDQEQAELEEEIRGLESDLDTEEAAQDTTPPAPAAPAAEHDERKEVKIMNTRSKIFARMGIQERDAMFAREDVKGWLGEVRAHIREKRAIQGVGLTIPTAFLPLLRENIENFSKLYRHVNVQPVAGEGRMPIMGGIHEAIWTDCCAYLTELDLTFNDAEVGCWKAAGYFAVCNANLEDSDIDLAAELLAAIGQAIGLALDKAILYGTGTRMPLGIVSRLAQTSQPADYPATARTWVDLHSTHIQTLSSALEGVALFKALLLAAGVVKGKYSSGVKVWAMSETTRTYLQANALTINANGAIVAGVDGSMPVIGGIVEVLDFIPDYVIVGGYLDLYLLAERAGTKFAQSEHVRFMQDQTVMKGTARYDGLPVIAEGFVAIGLNGVTPTAQMTFAPDEANEVDYIALNTATASVAVGGKVQLKAMMGPGEGAVTWTSGTEAKATVDANGLVTGVATGSSVITATCNGKTASCTVTVTSA
ncbi:MAG: phage major capsid protein [Oscillospiraceae bacterium]|nr:phage major capsid protein [Oscillospiraceae bacterium]